MPDRLTYRVNEAAEVLGISRAKTYELIGAGEIPTVRIGGCVRVPVDALREWIVAHTTTLHGHEPTKARGRT
jgi:excisionase family DNA binding protein